MQNCANKRWKRLLVLNHVDRSREKSTDLLLLKISHVRRSSVNARGLADTIGFEPPGKTQTPAITFFQAGKTRWMCRGQVIATRTGEFEKVLRNLRTDSMNTVIIGTSGHNNLQETKNASARFFSSRVLPLRK